MDGQSTVDAAKKRSIVIDNRFPKCRRIPTSAEFSEIINRGAFATDETLIVNALPHKPAEGLPAAARTQRAGRLGVTIPRKTGTAVVRNRWKRLIREAYRLQRHDLPAGFDFVVRPRRGAVADFHRVSRSLRRLTQRAAQDPARRSQHPTKKRRRGES